MGVDSPIFDLGTDKDFLGTKPPADRTGTEKQLFSQQTPSVKGKNEGVKSISGFANAAFAKIGEAMGGVAFAPNAKDKSLSRLIVIK